jgi:DNA-binding response OmpR family regulator
VREPSGPGAPIALIVDDDLTMRLLIRQTLERVGFACHEAEHGAAALERFPQLQPDIVLLDVVMPHMDGYAACAGLRATPGGAFVPVLMLTGLDDVESIDRAYGVGATDFISKPINWGILSHRVRYILRASQAFSGLAKNRAGLESAQRIARLGSWEWDLPRDQVRWSDETYRILGLARGPRRLASPRSWSASIPKTGRRCRKPCNGWFEPASSRAAWCGCSLPTASCAMPSCSASASGMLPARSSSSRARSRTSPS